MFPWNSTCLTGFEAWSEGKVSACLPHPSMNPTIILLLVRDSQTPPRGFLLANRPLAGRFSPHLMKPLVVRNYLLEIVSTQHSRKAWKQMSYSTYSSLPSWDVRFTKLFLKVWGFVHCLLCQSKRHEKCHCLKINAVLKWNYVTIITLNQKYAK